MGRLGQTLAVTAMIAVALVVAQHVFFPLDPSSTLSARAAQSDAEDRVQTTGSTSPAAKH